MKDGKSVVALYDHLNKISYRDNPIVIATTDNLKLHKSAQISYRTRSAAIEIHDPSVGFPVTSVTIDYPGIGISDGDLVPSKISWPSLGGVPAVFAERFGDAIVAAAILASIFDLVARNHLSNFVEGST